VFLLLLHGPLTFLGICRSRKHVYHTSSTKSYKSLPAAVSFEQDMADHYTGNRPPKFPKPNTAGNQHVFHVGELNAGLTLPTPPPFTQFIEYRGNDTESQSNVASSPALSLSSPGPFGVFPLFSAHSSQDSLFSSNPLGVESGLDPSQSNYYTGVWNEVLDNAKAYFAVHLCTKDAFPEKKSVAAEISSFVKNAVGDVMIDGKISDYSKHTKIS
jgi:hypothetical protein